MLVVEQANPHSYIPKSSGIPSINMRKNINYWQMLLWQKTCDGMIQPYWEKLANGDAFKAKNPHTSS